MEETFTYDGMNRLTGVTLKRPSGQDLVCAVTYDPLGRMTSRQAVTAENGVPQVTSVFSQPVFDPTKLHALASATTTEGMFPATPQAVTYTGFDKVGKVKQGNDSLCYTYGYDRQRILMEEHVGGLTRTKRYVGNCEFVTESDGTTTAEYCLTYLTGPTGVYAVVVNGSDGDAVHYILKDNLGSWTTITNANGTVEQRLSFDAWGNLRDPNTWSGSFTGAPMFDRGFTGHEHLYNFGLINMNGRMYDPVMSVFLSVDQCVQSSENAQGFNRYAYCMFNPLKYTDPTGWLAGGGHTGYTPNSSANAFDPYAFYGGHIPLEPRDLGLRELSTADPIITWMEENSLHGSGNGPKGGWYLYGNEIHWSPEVSSQDDLKKLGMEEGFFIGHSFTDELNHTYYSLLGYEVDIKESGGLAGEIFPLIDIALCKYENDKSSKNKDFFDPTIAEPSTTNFGVIKYVLGSDNIYSFATNNFMVYLQVFDGSSGKRENSMNAAFRGLSDSYVFNPNNHYGLSSHTSFVPGYDLYFNNPYANPKCWRVMIVFPTIPVRNNFIDRYNNVFGYGNY